MRAGGQIDCEVGVAICVEGCASKINTSIAKGYGANSGQSVFAKDSDGDSGLGTSVQVVG
jgi:hypothetical protein